MMAWNKEKAYNKTVSILSSIIVVENVLMTLAAALAGLIFQHVQEKSFASAQELFITLLVPVLAMWFIVGLARRLFRIIDRLVDKFLPQELIEVKPLIDRLNALLTEEEQRIERNKP